MYEGFDQRLPGAKFRIKILEQPQGRFEAHANFAVKDERGSADWICGSASSQEAAIEQLLGYVAAHLKRRETWTDADIEWSDPHDF